MKKIFDQPVLKVVRMHNDIIATSFGDGKLGASVSNDATTSTNGYNDNMFVGGRRGFDSDYSDF